MWCSLSRVTSSGTTSIRTDASGRRDRRRTPSVRSVTLVGVCRAVPSRLCVNGVATRKVSHLVRKVAGVWILGSECVVCGVPARGVCGSCTNQLEPPVIPPLLAIESSTVLCSYEGVGAQLVRAVKYGNRRQAITPMVQALVPSLPTEVDAVIPVPSDPARVRDRGYDLTATLAKRIASRVESVVLTPLERVTASAQTGQGRVARQHVQYRAYNSVPERVILVDDVVTTGATAVACALALGLAGARSISFVALAATPISKDRMVAAS